MLRADQDKDGVLSLQEFMLWFHTEIAAALPFKRNGTGVQVSPLYNRFVYYMLAESGSGVRRKATGLQLGQFLRLCQDHRVTSDSKMARNAAQLARSSAFSDRVLGKMESGTRMQFVQFVSALQSLCDRTVREGGIKQC